MYHINEAGEAKKCSAKQKCPFGLELDKHFRTKQEAQDAYEADKEAFTVVAPNSLSLSARQEELLTLIPHLPNGKTARQVIEEQFKCLTKPEVIPALALARQALGNMAFGRERGIGIKRMPDAPYYSEEIVDEAPNWSPGDPTDGLVLEVYTRNGGGNREHYCDEDDPEDSCLGCTVDAMQEDPSHLNDYDDSYDCTYATFVFKLPDGLPLPATEKEEKLGQDQQRAAYDKFALEKGQRSPLDFLPVNQVHAKEQKSLEQERTKLKKSLGDKNPFYSYGGLNNKQVEIYDTFLKGKGIEELNRQGINVISRLTENYRVFSGYKSDKEELAKIAPILEEVEEGKVPPATLAKLKSMGVVSRGKDLRGRLEAAEKLKADLDRRYEKATNTAAKLIELDQKLDFVRTIQRWPGAAEDFPEELLNFKRES